MLKILSWNIRQGGASRKAAIVKHLINFDATIIVLSEYRNNQHGLYIRQHLLRAGYKFQTVTAATLDENSVLIASKEVHHSRLFFDVQEEYKHNLIMQEYDAFNLVGVYLPHKKKHQLFNHLKTIASLEKPGIITGDFNTGINGLDQKGSSFWYEEELFKLKKMDYVDAFRYIHGDIKEYSWYSHQGNGYRYDHFYCHTLLTPMVKACYYIHKWREEGLSDHAPMVMELG